MGWTVVLGVDGVEVPKDVAWSCLKVTDWAGAIKADWGVTEQAKLEHVKTLIEPYSFMQQYIWCCAGSKMRGNNIKYFKSLIII